MTNISKHLVYLNTFFKEMVITVELWTNVIVCGHEIEISSSLNQIASFYLFLYVYLKIFWKNALETNRWPGSFEMRDKCVRKAIKDSEGLVFYISWET